VDSVRTRLPQSGSTAAEGSHLNTGWRSIEVGNSSAGQFFEFVENLRLCVSKKFRNPKEEGKKKPSIFRISEPPQCLSEIKRSLVVGFGKNSKEFHSSHERASQKTGGRLMYIL
jgi:hypothetical protein